VSSLRKIADLCQKRGIALVLVDTPVTGFYHSIIPQGSSLI